MTYTFSTLMKRFLSAFLICALSLMAFRGEGQNYIQLEDASGYNFTDAAKVAEIEAAVNELIQTFPAQFQNDFKVFDFGFYLHQESYSGGFPEAFQTKLNQIASQSLYYLAFGKQTDANGIYTQFWVDLNLPDSDKFACLDQVNGGLRNSFQERLSSHVNLQHRLNDLVPDTYYESELSTINELNSLLTTLWGCCDGSSNAKSLGETCVFCYEEGYQVLEQMISEGFVLQEIEIPENGDPDYFDTGSGGLAAVGQKKESKTGLEKSATTANITFKFRGDPEEWDLDNLINEIVVNPHVDYLNHRLGLALTSGNVGKHFYKYPRDCSLGFSEGTYQDYENDVSDLKIIVCVININNKVGILGYKTDVSAAFQQSTRNNPELKNEVVIPLVHDQFDALGSSKISDLSLQYLKKNGSPNSFDFTSLEEENPTQFNAYADATSKYIASTSSINVSNEFRQLWAEEYNFFLEGFNNDLTRGQDLITKIMVNWNMGSYAVHAFSSIFNYRRTRNELVLELLLGFECARNAVTSEEQSSFDLIYAGGIKLRNGRRVHLDYLLDGIDILDVRILPGEGIYSVNTQGVTSAPVPQILAHSGLTNGFNGSVSLYGSPGFSCIIITKTEAQANQLLSKFNNGTGEDLSSVYQEDVDKLIEAANNCVKERAKDILSSASSCVLSQLNNEIRIKLINCLSSENWFLEGGVGETEELFLIKLLGSVENPCCFISAANQPVESGGLKIENLLRAIDYPTPSKALLGALITIFENCKKTINAPDDCYEISEPQGFLSIDFGHIGTLTLRTLEYSITSKNQIIFKPGVTLLTEGGAIHSNSPELGPYDVFTPLELISDVKVEDIQLQGNVEYGVVPAILAPIILKHYFVQKTFDDLSTQIDLTLFLAGVAELNIAITAYETGAQSLSKLRQLALSLTDVGVTFADFVCKENPSSDICKEWNKVSFYIAIGLLAYSADDILNVSKKIARYKELLEKFKDYPNVIDFLKKVDNIPEEIFIRLENLNLSITTDEALIQALNTDLADLNFFNFLTQNSSELLRWENLHTQLPTGFKSFAKDVQHLKFLQNSDVENTFDWIIQNRTNLFNEYPNLTPGEIISLAHYTTTEGYQINYWLRANRNNSAVQSSVEWSTEHGENFLKFIDSAFGKLPGYTQNEVLLRLEGRLHEELLDALNSNTPLKYPHFISTAKNNNSSFIDGGNSYNVLFEINPNHEAKMIDMQPFSRAENTDIGDEIEVLIFRGKKMKITSIEYKDFPATNDIQLYSWVTNDGPSGFLDANGVSIPTNPNAIDPTIYHFEDFLDNDMTNVTSEQLEAAKKILTLSVEIID